MSKFDILSNLKDLDVQAEPFVYSAKRDAIDNASALILMNEFPSIEVVTEGKPYTNNQRFSYSASSILNKKDVSQAWLDFISYHTSSMYWKKFVSLFGDGIKSTYPELEQKLGRLEDWRIGIRNIDKFPDVDIVLDAQICINTPVSERSSVKIAHIDNERQLIGGLFYLRKPEDDSTGSDLEIFKLKKTPKFHGARLIDDRFVQKVAEVPYSFNTLVLFVNSMKAVHGVSPRSITSHPRIFVNFIAEVADPLFNLKPYKEGFLDKILRKI